jgi:hypothetical protein
MKPYLIALAAIGASFLGGWTPSPPLGTQTLYSQAFQMAATCAANAGDMVYTWGINGQSGGAGVVPPPGTKGKSFIYPWLPTDITIHGVELTVLPAAPSAPTPAISFLMVGNNADGDAMVFLPSGQSHITQWYPSGTGFQFPGTSDGDSTTYIDLHGACTAGQWAVVMVVFYYTIN